MAPDRTSGPDRIAVVLAAGQGKRMRSALPKVLHEVAGRPMLARVLATARLSGCDRLLVVVGHRAESVRAAFPENDITWVEQREQRGTGHALLQAAALASDRPALLLVLSGDVPLVRAATLDRLARAAAAGWGAMAAATLREPGTLGRVLTRPDGTLDRIVEVADADAGELAICRVNAGLYALPAPEIFDFLAALEPDNAQGELYLTDALGNAAAAGRRIEVVELEDPDEALGVNDRADLARVHRLLLERKARELQRGGVTLFAPERTAIEPESEIAPDSVVHADVALLGANRVGTGSTLHQGVWMRDSTVGQDSVIEPYSVLDGATVGNGCRVGPFARLRPGTVLGDGARVGNFVEIKNSRLGRKAKAGHLAYLGDAEVGDGANIGAGAVTCNYDGESKHRTEIGAGAFIGSDTMLVAPVTIGAHATTGAGSVITRDVPDGALAVERSPQRTVPGWAERRVRTAPPTDRKASD
ncbi:MAG: bifunctional UDP-N-acetylglucosamine diphosphorylase/glucosamine-1-phosphate N-acetyltransferase GlmU [Thermoanaerobaculia bacterium]|jgi:bifunctional UDP-N-acetylglucosamine pyrophosphorylase/glucosamine-1-phosphate N-acetyltransferase|nr:bifunctional UDP-N-acetylglucosamine diphosphorylase/glucosamine-1-phosphate N-acetyltransferase GlmU [Thermoanaerobaculia bacterium]MBP9825684.1 bifunctional UDP-N-acetylglucosamine diphosphorylase/glucosamine-1-phosphate N-acetyltransferase GlmU [Thermoanaerobaculia bacterium]